MEVDRESHSYRLGAAEYLLSNSRAEIERLRKALQKIAELRRSGDDWADLDEAQAIARLALIEVRT